MMVRYNKSEFHIVIYTKSYILEPEILSMPTEKDDPITNQDGWLNALSLQKLTNTVRNYSYLYIKKKQGECFLLNFS